VISIIVHFMHLWIASQPDPTKFCYSKFGSTTSCM